MLCWANGDYQDSRDGNAARELFRGGISAADKAGIPWMPEPCNSRAFRFGQVFFICCQPRLSGLPCRVDDPVEAQQGGLSIRTGRLAHRQHKAGQKDLRDSNNFLELSLGGLPNNLS